MSAADCLFCRIVRGEIPAERVHETETTLAFRDIDPKAPVHVLIVPKRHIPSTDALVAADAAIAGALVLAARDIAHAEGIAAGGYRLVLNTGADAGQSVAHIHMHLLGGRDLRWPPG